MECKNNHKKDKSCKNSFLMYHDFHEQISVLSDEDAGILIKAIFEYERTGVCPELPILVKSVFIPIRQTLDKNAEKYEERVKTNRLNGQLGGRPKTERSQTERFSEKAKKPDNDNGNDKGNEKEKTKDLPPAEANEPPSISESEKTEPKPKPQQGKSDRYSAAFEQFWKIYPKRNGKRGSKDGAFVNWTRLLQGKRELFGMPMPTGTQLIQAVRSYAAHCSCNNQYPQDAQTWLGAGNHWKEFLPSLPNQASEGGLDLENYCKLPDGSIDMKKMLCVKRALDGDPNYAAYLPTTTV